MNTVKKQSRRVGVAGGFINQLMGNNSTEPVVGEGATLLSYSDRHAYEVISVSEDKMSCQIREMNSTNIGQSYGDERYTYASNPEGNVIDLEWSTKKSKWVSVSYSVEIIKALASRLQKEYGWGWLDFLPNGLTQDDLFDKKYEDNYYNSYKIIEGVTKRYKNTNPVSVIFGVCETYCDPSF